VGVFYNGHLLYIDLLDRLWSNCLVSHYV